MSVHKLAIFPFARKYFLNWKKALLCREQKMVRNYIKHQEEDAKQRRLEQGRIRN